MAEEDEFASACSSVSEASARSLSTATLLEREAALLRCCIRCPERQALGHCPGRSKCRDVRRLGLEERLEGLERVRSSVIPIQQILSRSPITTAPLAAVVGGTNGTSQAGTG